MNELDAEELARLSRSVDWCDLGDARCSEIITPDQDLWFWRMKAAFDEALKACVESILATGDSGGPEHPAVLRQATVTDEILQSSPTAELAARYSAVASFMARHIVGTEYARLVRRATVDEPEEFDDMAEARATTEGVRLLLSIPDKQRAYLSYNTVIIRILTALSVSAAHSVYVAYMATPGTGGGSR